MGSKKLLGFRILNRGSDRSSKKSLARSREEPSRTATPFQGVEGEVVLDALTVAVSDEKLGSSKVSRRLSRFGVASPGRQTVTDENPACPIRRVDHYVEDGRCIGIADWRNEARHLSCLGSNR